MLESHEPTLFYIPYQRFLDEVEAVARRATLRVEALAVPERLA